MNVMEMEHTVKTRGNRFRLGPLDIHLVRGEILGVMGRPGAGKTTLLRLVWGFLRPDAGRVRVFGRTPHLEQVRVRAETGYMPQSPVLDDAMTGTRFMALISIFYPTWNWERAYDLANYFDLEVEKTIGELSVADRTRLGLITALTHRPGLLVLDEPGTGLDTDDCASVFGAVRRIAAEDGAGVILSSCISSALDGIVDTVLMLDRGRVVEYAPAEVLRERYSQLRLDDVFRNAVERPRPASRIAPRFESSTGAR